MSQGPATLERPEGRTAIDPRRPNYLVIGASKAASSSLCIHLGKHPDIFMYGDKAVRYFNDDARYAQGWAWYLGHFDGAEGKAARGEGSGHYSMKEVYPDSASRIVRDLPEVKLVYIVRDPLPRIESYWLQLRANGNRQTSPDFNEGVRGMADTLVGSSDYWGQLAAYRELGVPDDRILVLFYEDFRRDPAAELRRCYTFLGVDPSWVPPTVEKPVNVSEGKLVYRGSLTRMQNLPGFKAIMRPFPERWKTAVRQRFFRAPVKGRPEWDQGTRTWVLDRLRDNAIKLLEWQGKPRDFWALDGRDPRA